MAYYVVRVLLIKLVVMVSIYHSLGSNPQYLYIVIYIFVIYWFNLMLALIISIKDYYDKYLIEALINI